LAFSFWLLAVNPSISIDLNMDQSHMAFWLKEFECFTTAIVANGEVPSSELSIRLLRKMKRVICCDGALQKLLSINIVPDVVVGDGDSMEGELLRGHEIPYYPDRSEEYNDLQKALKYCTAKGYDNILLMGCGGLREDHFIANLSILAMYSENKRIRMLTEHGDFGVINRVGEIPSYPGMQVSVFPSHSKQRFWFTGLKYPVHDRSFKWLWEGSLNEAVGEAFIVEASDDEPVVVYRALGR
jgi:thiamine pyrophosphokinase